MLLDLHWLLNRFEKVRNSDLKDEIHSPNIFDFRLEDEEEFFKHYALSI